MILSTIKKYINLILKNENPQLNQNDNEIIQIYDKSHYPKYLKIIIKNKINIKSLLLKLEPLLPTEELYKVTIKVWGKGQSDEDIVFHESVKCIVHRVILEECLETVDYIIEEKKNYYNLDFVSLTELTFIKVNKAIDNGIKN